MQVADLGRERRVSGRKALGTRHHHAELHLRAGRRKGRVAEGIDRTRTLWAGRHIERTCKIIERVGNRLGEIEFGDIETGDTTIRAHRGIAVTEGARCLDLQVGSGRWIVRLGVEDDRPSLHPICPHLSLQHQLKSGTHAALKQGGAVRSHADRGEHRAISARQTEEPNLRPAGNRSRGRGRSRDRRGRWGR